MNGDLTPYEQALFDVAQIEADDAIDAREQLRELRDTIDRFLAPKDAPLELIPLPTQLALAMAAAKQDGHAEAAEWIARVYGGMEDPFAVSQEIRGRS
jgi:hypothetical protein